MIFMNVSITKINLIVFKLIFEIITPMSMSCPDMDKICTIAGRARPFYSRDWAIIIILSELEGFALEFRKKNFMTTTLVFAQISTHLMGSDLSIL